jgi:hypothetical protein
MLKKIDKSRLGAKEHSGYMDVACATLPKFWQWSE